tara:strand:+ start:3915 stop:4193 length:279 start_codon:yes stop_codon:yes gene_type:complete
MVKLTQIKKDSFNMYRITNIYVNPKHIVFMSEESQMRQELVEGKIDLGLDKNITFTKIKINESANFSEIIVVGTPEMIESKINTSTKKLLRG